MFVIIILLTFVCTLYAHGAYRDNQVEMTKGYFISICLDQRRLRSDNTYPVRLRVFTQSPRKQKLYVTDFNYTEEDFKNVWLTSPPKEKYKDRRLELDALKVFSNKIADSLPHFTFEAFEKKYLRNTNNKDTIQAAFSDYANELRKIGRIGTAVSYECSLSSFDKFYKGAKFTDITVDVLNKYEKWMLDQNNSITTVGIYLRNLRALFNILISDGTLAQESYPFGKKKYEIPTGNNIKKALSLEDVALIYYQKTEPFLERSKAYWLFIYLCNGINVKDMCLLKYKNIKDNVLEFERAKTARTKRKVEPIRVHLNDDLLQIIKKWGNKNIGNETYIFPILTKDLTPERERQLIQQFIGVVNDHMKIIAKQLNIQKSATTYVARHSFATILQRSGASTEFISEALGHSNVATTQSYLAGFEDETKKETAKALTAFKKKGRIVKQATLKMKPKMNLRKN